MEKKPEEQKGLFKRLKEGIDDHEEQMVVLGAMVRLGVVIWSGFIITLNYVELPMVKKSPGGDITFPASIFTGALATFGLSTGCLLYTSPSPRDYAASRMPSSA